MNIDGVLTIRTIQGRNGPFNVGRLITDLGEFAVKDTLLDQYDEGRYEGNFSITQIFPASYFAAGRFVVEVRATLKNLTLDGVDELKPEDTAVAPEPDPMDDQILPVAPKPESSEEVSTQPESEVESDDDEVLFGTLWPLGAQVKLDPTVDRKQFREQRNRLKALGYTFDAIEQIWSMNTH